MHILYVFYHILSRFSLYFDVKYLHWKISVCHRVKMECGDVGRKLGPLMTESVYWLVKRCVLEHCMTETQPSTAL